jgi:hypothetical protein
MILNEPILVEISPGELVDKLTILEIKSVRIVDDAKQTNVLRELATLRDCHARFVAKSTELGELASSLRSINERLWEVEDSLRECERTREFGPRFVELARSVYHLNDERSALKRRINELCKSRLVEEKSYTRYD